MRSTEHVDVRVERTRETVLAAARELLTLEGPLAVTPQRIANETGVSRSTLHRHWPDARHLLIEAVADFPTPTDVPLLGDLRLDIGVDLHQLRLKLGDPAEVAVMMSLLSYASFDKEFADAIGAHSAAHLERLGRVLEAGQHDGTLRADIDPADAAALLAGPLFFRRAFLGLEVTADFVDEVIETFITAHAAAPTPRREGAPVS
jgi:AcrR family transcriptional regulator